MKIKKSGVYKIRNILNEECYIGSSEDIFYRWGRHKYSFKQELVQVAATPQIQLGVRMVLAVRGVMQGLARIQVLAEMVASMAGAVAVVQ